MTQWYAIRTATRLEQSAAKLLRQANFTVYVPCDTVERRLGGTKEPVQRPRYPGYAFLRCWPEQVALALAIDHVHNVVRYLDARGDYAPMPIPAAVVKQVFLEQLAGRYDRRTPTYTPVRGDTVRIAGGKWAGQGYIATVISISADGRRAIVSLKNGFKLDEAVDHLLEAA